MMPMIASADDPGARFAGGVREQRQTEAEQTVGAHLQHHAGQHDGAGGGCFDVRVGQPGMQREQRNLDGERDEEGQEEQQLLGAARTSGCPPG